MAKKSRTNRSNILNLPKEIMSSILVQFPVKQLTRLKTVCKSWLALLTSNDFVELHTRHSEHFPCLEDRTLIFFAQESNLLYLASLDTQRPCKFDFKDLNLGFIFSSCKGLLLCGHYEYGRFGLVLVNPSTFQYKKLSVAMKSRVADSFGFGYDHITDDYKVVSFASQYVARNKNDVGTMVYSLKANSWKKCISHITPVHNLDPWSGVLMNNNLLHWYSTSHDQSQVFSFDVCTEKWSNVPLLSQIVVKDIGVQSGLLCVMGHNRWVSGYKEYVWVMKEYGVEESWVKLFNMTDFEQYCGNGSWKIAPISYAEEGDDDEIWLMNADTKKFTWYGIRGKKTREAQVLSSQLTLGRAACTRSLVRLT